jgi:acetyl-CoA acyltransferase 1
MYLAGFPDKVPVATLNRQCSSGLQAFATVAGQIKAGIIDIGIAAGVESMSNHDMMQAVGTLNDKVFAHDKAKNCLISMGQTSENVVEKYNISRDEQDKFALRSQQKAYKAQQAGNFKDEIVPVTTKVVAEDGSSKTITISEDEGIRGDTTLASLNKLRPAFKQGGSTTAGNSSQVSDGAAAVLLCSRRKAKELGLKPLLRFRSFAVVGVPPEIMGVGPAYAIPEAVKKAGVQLSDIDVFEINEAFASQAGWTIKKLGIPEEKVNPNGGAIALGHPLGCTGARQIATLLSHMKRNKLRFGSTSMCIGTGMGAASVFENEQ